MPEKSIRVRGATAHNLREIDLDLPHGQWLAIVGPSGSGKTSLVFDTLVREGEHRFLANLSTRARQHFGKLGRAPARELSGLPATVAVGQRAFSPNVRSTVGTLTGTLDLLRLLFARAATSPGGQTLTRSHFSFNHPLGACPRCSGLGVEDRVDPALLIADANKSLRAGALVPTLKNGYTVYSQVTLNVLDTICKAHGFDVHTVWHELTATQRDVILYGTRALKVPFGKHPIESRMKWEGITARPREEGYYRGLVPVIEETLLRNRNPNILRFVRSVACKQCGGSRLGDIGREAILGQVRLPHLLSMAVNQLLSALDDLPAGPILQALQPELKGRLRRMQRLGLGHLSLDRESTGLSGGEGQRLRLAAQLSAGLCGMLFAMDEPTLGLHPSEQAGLGDVLDELREQGNTLAVVEHDPDMVRHADRLVRLGPGAGTQGGQLLENGPLPEHPLGPSPRPKSHKRPGNGVLSLHGASLHNLKGGSYEVHLATLNVVMGRSGAGKSSLVFGTLLPALTGQPGGPYRSLEGATAKTARALDARPIGRTSRSTPATWSGLFDLVRKRFAHTPAAKELGYGAGHFSYNNKHGRCPECSGLGTTHIGLHLFEDVELTCEACNGGRYAAEILRVHLEGKSIAAVLALTVAEALEFFAQDKPIADLCSAMDELGLGHLPLGQPSNKLSRGESQRVKLATLLGTTGAKPTLLLLDEPDRGLFPSDVRLLLKAMDRLVDAGHTLVAISHHRHLWAAADWLVELDDGDVRVVSDLDAKPLRENRPPRAPASMPTEIQLKGVRTHNLQNIDVSFPRGAMTVVCGVSGSGKSSLAFDTLAAEAWYRYAESLPFEVRRHVQRMPRPELESATGLGPTLSLRQEPFAPGSRSTVATQSGLGPVLRLLYARAGSVDGEPCGLSAEHFSSDRALGACAHCAGRGFVQRCEVDSLVSDPDKSLLDGALAGSKPGAFFTEPAGQYIATLRSALGSQVDLSAPWKSYSESTRAIAMEGAGEQCFQVDWEMASGHQEGPGAHRFESKWIGFLALVEQEAEKRGGHKNAGAWTSPLTDRPCAPCNASGLAQSARSVRLGSMGLVQLLELPLVDVRRELSGLVRDAARGLHLPSQAAIDALIPEIETRLNDLIGIGLGHLPLGRRSQKLSSSERQRVRLAALLHCDLANLTIVLDEPSAGLQSAEIELLCERLRELCERGTTLVLVEHEALLLRAADHLIELGPAAGEQGGRLIAAGPPELVLAGDGPTAMALRAQTAPHIAKPAQEHFIVRQASLPSQDAQDFRLPRSGLVVVEGPSGAGKSTLLFDVIARSFQSGKPQGCVALEPPAILNHFRAIHGSRSLSRRGSLVSALDLVAALQTFWHSHGSGPDLPRHAFSFSSPKGRCQTCNGTGRERVPMDFLADLDLACPACDGKRYAPEVLAARWNEMDPAQFLSQPVQVLVPHLPPGKLLDGAHALEKVGLGYLGLGRSMDTLSGGERQRVLLARSLNSAQTPALHLFDGPTAGLHPADVARLVVCLRELAGRGDLLVASTRNNTLLEAADVRLRLQPPRTPEATP